MKVSALLEKLAGMNPDDTIAAVIFTADDVKSTIEDRSDEFGFTGNEFTTDDINEVLQNIENDVEQYGLEESIDFQLDVFVTKFIDDGIDTEVDFDDE